MRKIFPVVAAGATTLALAGGTYGYATVNKTVSLTVDGETRQVATMAGTVAELLQSQDITVGTRDQVAPAPTAALSDGGQVAVDHGRQVTFAVDGASHVLWTTADTVEDAVGASGLDLEGAKLSPGASTAIAGDGLTVTAATRKSVNLDAAGKTKKLTTHAQTVSEVLREAKVSVDRDDELSPRPSTAVSDGDTIVFTDVEVRTEKKTSRIGYQTVRKNSAKLAKGTTKVDTEGESGRRTLTYRVVSENGKTTSRKQVSAKVTDAPTTEVVLVGTKVAKKPATSAAAPSSRSGSSSSSSSSKSSKSSSGSSTSTKKAPSVASGGVWDKLAQCEAGGNWSINTGNGFYGGLQFTLQTWRGYGGTGMPHQASREQQIAIAKKVQAGQGWGAWPACSAKLGLR